MSRDVLWSRAALDDFETAIVYIAERNPAAAQKVTAAIDRTIEDLARRPLGRKGRVPGTYEKVVSRLPYVVAYAITHSERGNDETIVILRIIHGARNWPRGQWPRESR